MRDNGDIVWIDGEKNRRFDVYRSCPCGTCSAARKGVGYLSWSDASGHGTTVWLENERVFQQLGSALSRMRRKAKMLSKRRLAGPLESLTLEGYCEMCGDRSGWGGPNGGLEPAFNPSGQPMTLCRPCRIGSAEVRDAQFSDLLGALRFIASNHKRAGGKMSRAQLDGVREAIAAAERI
jgi:hypothetical protein